MVRYLAPEEKGRCEKLWAEAFPEDSRAFRQYYFREKMKDNRVLVSERDGEVIAMLHRNPYRIAMRGTVHACDYIVAVATAETERHKGHMRSLLLAMFRDMYEEQMPFTFLMPARESIYLPFDFRFIYDQPRWVLKYSPGLRREEWKEETLAGDLAEWQNAWLNRQFEVFAVRDADYLLRMQKELASENGVCRLIYDDDWFIGMESEWGTSEREMRYLYTGERYRSLAGTKPAIMARIICLPEFVKAIRLSEECPEEEITVEIGVNDLFLPQNQGEWLWRLTKDGSEMTQASRFISKGRGPVFSIAELVQWLFGYRIPEQAKEVPFGEYIEPFHGIFLDEVV